MSEFGYQFEGEVITEQDIELKEPRSYHVVLYNDNYTTMEFVVFVLETIFRHSGEAAQKIMLDVHQKGKGDRRDLYPRYCRDKGLSDPNLSPRS